MEPSERPSETPWTRLALRFRDSVVQLRCTGAKYDVYRPYQSPRDRLSSGTGFIVDGEKGYVLTNAHVVTNAINITGRLMRTGKMDIPVRLLSISRERDLALCQLDLESLKAMGVSSLVPMTFGDSMYLRETQEVMAIGYPLGFEGVKYTTGVISGFFQATDETRTSTDERQGDPEEEPAYIQITAPINPGNSGGPIVNMEGQVVGVAAAGYLFSQNVAFAIPSRTCLAVWGALSGKEKGGGKGEEEGDSSGVRVIPLPRYAFEFNKTNDDLLLSRGSDPHDGGVYVKAVYPGSCWYGTLEKGDIVLRIRYEETQGTQRTSVEGLVDRYGEVSLPELKFGRQLSIKEVFDMLPFDAPVSLDIRRKGELFRATTTFSYLPSSLRPYLYPRFQPLHYLIVAGLCLGDLTMNHLHFENLKKYAYGRKRYKPKVVVDQVFPGTNVSQLDLFSKGTIIKKVQGKVVTTIQEVRSTLTSSHPDYITIESQDGDLFTISWERAHTDNQAQIAIFRIKDAISIP